MILGVNSVVIVIGNRLFIYVWFGCLVWVFGGLFVASELFTLYVVLVVLLVDCLFARVVWVVCWTLVGLVVVVLCCCGFTVFWFVVVMFVSFWVV